MERKEEMEEFSFEEFEKSAINVKYITVYTECTMEKGNCLLTPNLRLI